MDHPFILIRRELHKIPELGFQEWKTQSYILDYLNTLSSERIEVMKWKTGLFVRILGKEGKRTVGYRSDIDGLPIVEQTDLSFSSNHTGQMHACGHDFHMSIALGVLSYFVDHPINDHLVFIFQPAEEGPGGALPMLESDEMKRLNIDVMMALHIAPELKVGEIGTKEGLLFANTSELFIDLLGKGGHAAYPHQTKDMVVAASSLVSNLQTVVSRNIDPLDSAVLTIGKLTAGTVQNVIAENARLEGTIRTLDPETMERIKSRIESIVKGVEWQFDCQASIDYGSNYYQVYNDPKTTEHFIQWAENKDTLKFVHSKEAMTGEDFGYMLKSIPGFMFWLGVDSPFGLHNGQLNPKEDAIPFAIDTITEYIEFMQTDE
ncbi:N-acetyldiaminopimelate deacetylase [Bacillus coahuilensis p1.1.43]|uniref:N-acetyldiaminopimelate deacetylase n=1 Tax=Bacillus coahuilensis p1.1.43 TaxID=1150625 RepID=A0A147KAH1_9BACI|nr:N-acetyldiaminopimelate deacetylase [Bacillus coahuilensis]KUP07630.1 N-acetyldiaminopimelate deacetylase [Bacillus coahuilensis p1.1.43]